MVVDHSKEVSYWVEFSGRGAFLVASAFSSVGKIPSAEMTQPIQVTDRCMNLHLWSWSHNCLSD